MFLFPPIWIVHEGARFEVREVVNLKEKNGPFDHVNSNPKIHAARKNLNGMMGIRIRQ